MEHPGAEYVTDLEELISILNNSVSATMNEAARRADYASIPVHEIVPTAQLSRDDRIKIFKHLAVYGTALTRTFAPIAFQFGPPLPVSMFVALSSIAGSEVIPAFVVSQVAAALTSLVDDLLNNTPEMLELKPIFSTAFLNKTYADKEN